MFSAGSRTLIKVMPSGDGRPSMPLAGKIISMYGPKPVLVPSLLSKATSNLNFDPMRASVLRVGTKSSGGGTRSIVELGDAHSARADAVVDDLKGFEMAVVSHIAMSRVPDQSHSLDHLGRKTGEDIFGSPM